MAKLGFRTETVDFSQQYVLAPTLKRMHELKLGAEILDAHVSGRDRVTLPFIFGADWTSAMS